MGIDVQIDAADRDLYQRIRSRVRRPRVLSGRSGVFNEDGRGGPAVVRIYDEIGFFGVMAEDVAAQLERITATEIEVQINSPGGDVFDGIAIFNALRAHPAAVTTRVDGIAASAASFIVQAGDRRVMLDSAQMMVHEARGVVIGTAQDMRDFADVIDRQNEIIANIYAQRSGRTVDEIREVMASETWLTDHGAVDAGLADEVINPASDTETTAAAESSAVQTLTADDVITAFRRALMTSEIPDADPAPGAEPPAEDEGTDPDAAAAASDTELLAAIAGAFTSKEAQR